MWKLQRDSSDSADFHMAATMSQEQQPFLQTLLRAPGPISGLAWKDTISGSFSVLVVGHRNNTGLRLFLVQDPPGGQAQPQQVRKVSWRPKPYAVVHREKTPVEANPSLLCHKQTVDLDKGNGGYPLFFQMALQQSSGLLLLADSRRTSLLALHIRGPRTSSSHALRSTTAVVNALDE